MELLSSANENKARGGVGRPGDGSGTKRQISGERGSSRNIQNNSPDLLSTSSLPGSGKYLSDIILLKAYSDNLLFFLKYLRKLIEMLAQGH